jgi:hypothetical protein
MSFILRLLGVPEGLPRAQYRTIIVICVGIFAFLVLTVCVFEGLWFTPQMWISLAVFVGCLVIVPSKSTLLLAVLLTLSARLGFAFLVSGRPRVLLGAVVAALLAWLIARVSER